MNELASTDESRNTLPPLRIHHLLALTAVFSCVMAVFLTIWRLRRIFAAETTAHELSTWGMVQGTAHWLALAVSLTILLFGRTWRQKGLPFPSQPGHWIAFYLAWRGLFRLAQDLIMMALIPAPTPVILVGSICAEVLFHVVAIGICVAAYRREQIRIWRWGWAVMVARSMLSIAFYMIYTIVMLYRFLYAMFWVNREIDWDWPIRVGHLSGFWHGLIVQYIVFAFVLFAVISDIRNFRRRHWSHWAVLFMLFVELSLLITWRYWAI